MKREFMTLILMIFISLSLSACRKKEIEIENEETFSALSEKESTDIQEEEIVSTFEEVRTDEEKEVPIEILDSTVIEFKDNYLQELAQKQADSFMIKDLQKISELEINMDEVTFPEELAYFSGLEKLEVKSNNQSDILWVTYCPTLKYLDLDYNYLEDISPLQESEIEVLVINTYGLMDLSGLENVSTLRGINVESDVLADVSALGNLTNLCAIAITSPSITSINLDLSRLKNIIFLKFEGQNLIDVTCLNSLKIPEDITYFMEGEVFAMFDFLKIPFMTISATEDVSQYRNIYDGDKRPEKERFKRIEIREAPLTDESIKAIAEVNYKYLSSIDFHLDRQYEFVTLVGVSKEIRIQYNSYMDILIAERGNPMRIEAVSVKGQSKAPESWEDAEIYYDGHLIGMEYSLEDILLNTGYSLGRNHEQVNLSYHLGAGKEEQFTLYKTSACEESMLSVYMFNPSETESKPLSACEIVKMVISRDTSIDLNLPQGNEEYRIVSWDYFTPLSFGEYHDNFAFVNADRGRGTMTYITESGYRIEIMTNPTDGGHISCYISYYEPGRNYDYEAGEWYIPISKIERITMTKDY